MAKGVEERLDFEDYLPAMAEKLGEEEFMEELCNGFRLFADAEKGVITLQSLKKNASRVLGMSEEMSEDEMVAMIEAADLNGDGVLDQNEFCLVMLRLSPSLMTEVRKRLQTGLQLDNIV
ncbi:hypothetical protein KI387_018261, partial [Taxus chinensis]